MSSGIPRILILDDEPSIRKMLASVFSLAGYDVRVAANGLEAMTICESESFDVLLSDVLMPGMDGHEFVQWLVQRSPGTQRILMSGYDGVRCEGCGHAPTPCAIVRKPFLPRDVVAIVDDIVAASLSSRLTQIIG